MPNAKGFVVAIGLIGGVLLCGSPSHAQIYPQEGLRTVDLSARYRVRYYRSYAFFRPVYFGGAYRYARRGWWPGMRSGDWVAIHGAAR